MMLTALTHESDRLTARVLAIPLDPSPVCQLPKKKSFLESPNMHFREIGDRETKCLYLYRPLFRPHQPVPSGTFTESGSILSSFG